MAGWRASNISKKHAENEFYLAGAYKIRKIYAKNATWSAKASQEQKHMQKMRYALLEANAYARNH